LPPIVFYRVIFSMDLISFFNALFGFFTIISWIISLLLIYVLLFNVRLPDLISEQLYNYATSVAVFSMVGSLIYSEVVGFIPCKFCWYQRYIMYPLAIFLIIGLFNSKFMKLGYFSVVGFFIGLYHIYLQNGGGSGGSCAIDVPCNLKYVNIFGFISIPVMAASGFLTIFLALLYYDLSRKKINE
jgi:disulfide bond formation protein DsbB